MRLRTEIVPDGDGEVVIRCRERDENIRRLELLIDQALGDKAQMVLTLGDTEYYIERGEILFFETSDGHVAAHTRDKMFRTNLTLSALEARLSGAFMRVSKFCIVNVAEICAISKDITGNGEVRFRASDKRTYVSRGYYKSLKERIYTLKGIT